MLFLFFSRMHGLLPSMLLILTALNCASACKNNKRRKNRLLANAKKPFIQIGHAVECKGKEVLLAEDGVKATGKRCVTTP